MLAKSLLTPEQNAAIDRLYEHDRTLFIAPLGFGKAVVALTALQEMLEAGLGPQKRVLVLAPLRVVELTLMPEVLQWSHLRVSMFASAVGDRRSRRLAMDSGARVVMINFESAGALIDEYGDQFDGLLVDEFTRLKTSGGALFKKLRTWVKRCVWRVGMTATPVAESGVDIYGQTLLLDDGAALGTRKEAFLDQYFWARGDYDLTPKSGAFAEISARLRNVLYVADGSAYKLSLPDVFETQLAIDFDNEQFELYDQLRKSSVVTVNNSRIVAPSAGVLALKLGQIAAGGLYDGDGEDRLVWRSSDYRDRVRGMLWSITEPTVVVYNYTFQRDCLDGIPVLGGGGTASARDVEAFNRGDLRFIAGHPKSLGQGLNLQRACRRMLMLSPVLSADMHQQVLGRIHRRGQTRDVLRETIVTPGSVHAFWAQSMLRKKSEEAAFMAALE